MRISFCVHPSISNAHIPKKLFLSLYYVSIKRTVYRVEASSYLYIFFCGDKHFMDKWGEGVDGRDLTAVARGIFTSRHWLDVEHLIGFWPRSASSYATITRKVFWSNFGSIPSWRKEVCWAVHTSIPIILSLEAMELIKLYWPHCVLKMIKLLHLKTISHKRSAIRTLFLGAWRLSGARSVKCLCHLPR